MDWYHDHSRTMHEQDHLAGLEEMRIDKPVVWALLMGNTTSRSIASTIAWPHEDVMIELRRLKGEGLIFDTEGQKSVLWGFSVYEKEHREYVEWVRDQKRPGGLFNPRESSDENEG